MLPRPPSSTLFPYPTLFRSDAVQALAAAPAAPEVAVRVAAHPVRDPSSTIQEHATAGERRPTVDHVEDRSEEHTSELQSPDQLVCRPLPEKRKTKNYTQGTA